MLPITVELVEELVAIETDWRYKYAGYMAYSQVGEYIEDLTQISGMVPKLVFDMGQHYHPYVRYAAIHCIG